MGRLQQVWKGVHQRLGRYPLIWANNFETWFPQGGAPGTRIFMLNGTNGSRSVTPLASLAPRRQTPALTLGCSLLLLPLVAKRGGRFVVSGHTLSSPTPLRHAHAHAHAHTHAARNSLASAMNNATRPLRAVCLGRLTGARSSPGRQPSTAGACVTACVHSCIRVAFGAAKRTTECARRCVCSFVYSCCFWRSGKKNNRMRA